MTTHRVHVGGDISRVEMCGAVRGMFNQPRGMLFNWSAMPGHTRAQEHQLHGCSTQCITLNLGTFGRRQLGFGTSFAGHVYGHAPCFTILLFRVMDGYGLADQDSKGRRPIPPKQIAVN